MLEIDLSRQAAKFLDRVPPKHGKQLAAKLSGLQENPLPHDSKLLKGETDLRRADAGEYRIIYRVQEQTLQVYLIGKRNDDEIYRMLRRK